VVTRPSDLVARIGGEEFAIILPNTRNLGAMQVATALCEAMRRRNVTHKGSPYGIMTISVGCATLIPRAGQQPIDLIEKADSALYQAKSDGRNRVCNSSCLERVEAKDSQQVGAGGMAD
jgi:diguanylate cyclase (GGDEF)-like protein